MVDMPNSVPDQRSTPLSLDQRIQELWSKRADSAEYVRGLIDLAKNFEESDTKLTGAMLREASLVASRLGDKLLVAEARVQLAYLCLLEGALDQVILQASYARVVAEAIGAADERIRAMCVLAQAHWQVGNVAIAEALWLELIDHARSAQDKAREADFLVELGKLYSHQGKFDQGRQMLLTAHAHYEASNDASLASSKNNLAMAFVRSGSYDEAVVWANRAVQLVSADQPYTRACMLHTLGLSLLRKHPDQPRLAIAEFERALALLQTSARNPGVEACCRIDLGKALCLANDYTAGIEQIEIGLALAEKSGQKREVDRAHKALQRSYAAIGAFDEAIKHCDKRNELLELEQVAERQRIAQVLNAALKVQESLPAWRADIFGAAPAV